MILNVENLEFCYPGRKVISNINFSVKRGEFLAILGINGAGKSTLLKCINKILKPSKGNILFDEVNLHNLSRRNMAKKIGYIPQQGDYNRLTVFDEVLLGRKPYISWEATKKDYMIVNDVIKLLNLDEYVLRYLDELSGGERQKVFIARMLAQKPDILLLDEPTSSLDLKNQIDVIKIVKRVVKEQNVIAVVTMHDLNLALRFANKFILLKEGRLFAEGGIEVMTPQNIESVYATSVIIEKIGDIPVLLPN